MEVSFTVIEPDASTVVLAALLNKLATKVSAPSVRVSLARVMLKLAMPSLPTLTVPCRLPPTTSPVLIPVPLSFQVRLVFAATLVVVRVKVLLLPSLTELAAAVRA